MMTAEAALIIIAYLQPPIIGVIFFSLAYRRLDTATAFASIGLVRQRRPGVRAFECAVSNRVGTGGTGSQGGLEGPYLAFVALFLIYDLDFLFILSEVTFFYHWSCPQAILGLVYVGLFILGA
jgi:hypothetical protein